MCVRVCVGLAHVFFIEVKLATRCVSSRTSRYKWAYNAHTPRRPRKHSGLERAQTVAEHLPAFMAHIIIMSTLTMGQGPEYTHMSRKCTLTNVEAACQTWKHICLPAGGLINKPECLCVCVPQCVPVCVNVSCTLLRRSLKGAACYLTHSASSNSPTICTHLPTDCVLMPHAIKLNNTIINYLMRARRQSERDSERERVCAREMAQKNRWPQVCSAWFVSSILWHAAGPLRC